MADEIARPEDLPDDMHLEMRTPADPTQKTAMPNLAHIFDGLRSMVQAYEMDVIGQAVAKYGSKREAARHLKIDVATLIRKMRREG